MRVAVFEGWAEWEKAGAVVSAVVAVLYGAKPWLAKMLPRNKELEELQNINASIQVLRDMTTNTSEVADDVDKVLDVVELHNARLSQLETEVVRQGTLFEEQITALRRDVDQVKRRSG